MDITTARALWEKYERRKRELLLLDLTPDQYEAAIQAILKELGL
jgi:hypothetical protein